MQSSRSKTIILGRGEGRGDMIGLSERREGEGGEGNFEGELNDRRASGEILVGYCCSNTPLTLPSLSSCFQKLIKSGEILPSDC